MKKLSDGQVKVAVEWWARAIMNPSSRPMLENVGESGVRMITEWARDPISDDQIKIFKAELRKQLKKRGSASREAITLKEEWMFSDPCYPVCVSLEKASIRTEMAPFLVDMTFEENGVQVSYDALETTQIRVGSKKLLIQRQLTYLED